MEHNSSSRRAPVGALSTRNLQTSQVRLLVLVLFIALSVLSLHSQTSAKPAGKALRVEKAAPITIKQKAASDCSACQQAYVECLASGGGGSCASQYNGCIENCQALTAGRRISRANKSAGGSPINQPYRRR